MSGIGGGAGSAAAGGGPNVAGAVNIRYPAGATALTNAIRPDSALTQLVTFFANSVRPIAASTAFVAGAGVGAGSDAYGYVNSVFDQFNAWVSNLVRGKELSALSELCKMALQDKTYMSKLQFKPTNLQTLENAGIAKNVTERDLFTFNHKKDALKELVVALVQYLEYYKFLTVQGVSGTRAISQENMDELAAEVLHRLMIWIHASRIHGNAKAATIGETKSRLNSSRTANTSWQFGMHVTGRERNPKEGIPLVRAQSVTLVGGVSKQELDHADGRLLRVIFENLDDSEKPECKGMLTYFLSVVGRADFSELTEEDCFNPKTWKPASPVPADASGVLAKKTRDHLSNMTSTLMRKMPRAGADPNIPSGGTAGVPLIRAPSLAVAGAVGGGVPPAVIVGAAADAAHDAHAADAGAGAGAPPAGEEEQGGGYRSRYRKSRRARRARKQTRRR